MRAASGLPPAWLTPMPRSARTPCHAALTRPGPTMRRHSPAGTSTCAPGGGARSPARCTTSTAGTVRAMCAQLVTAGQLRTRGPSSSRLAGTSRLGESFPRAGWYGPGCAPGGSRQARLSATWPTGSGYLTATASMPGRALTRPAGIGEAMTELPRGEVTIADLYRSLEAIGRDMSAMASDMRVIVARVETNGTMIGDHETRLRALEQWAQTARGGLSTARIIGAGVAAVAGAAAGWLAALSSL